MSYLDDSRVLFAAERTLLAWQRTVKLRQEGRATLGSPKQRPAQVGC